ncbi:anti-sigma factor [Promicromonospora sukumoe]|uniref:anti-sigma factor n=1 Tax=Promicromonospora sukumoe TaxID=88382 RepID=UPI00365243E7
MSHIDDETLALHALGEPVLDAAQRDHLRTCPTCATAVRGLGRVVEGARAPAAAAPADLVAPPPGVWARVREELEDTAGAADAPAAQSESSESTAPAARPEPSDLRARRRWLPALVAACTALVLGVAGGVLWERRGDEGAETTVAVAELDALPGWQGASGEAVVHESPDGRRQIVVSVDAPVPEGTYREVWLLRPDISGLVSLGMLDGDQGRFDLPAGLDLADYPLVDVSEEHFDGDPAHSGESVVRGDLSA